MCFDGQTMRLIALAFSEDSARGDITTAPIAAGIGGRAEIRAKEALTVCGTQLLEPVFSYSGGSVSVEILAHDGTRVKSGDIIAEITGSADILLRAERIALNFMQRLSGIATHTAEFVSLLDPDSRTAITDTRKTTPGWRLLEKYAVRVGGGKNHRFGLDDGVLVKDNHIALAGSIRNAVEKIRNAVHHLVRIEVETIAADQVREALDAGCDVIMLDNMDNAAVASCLEIIDGRVAVEVSGGITAERIPALSRMNVDLISVGGLTHSATARDINLTFFRT